MHHLLIYVGTPTYLYLRNTNTVGNLYPYGDIFTIPTLLPISESFEITRRLQHTINCNANQYSHFAL